jgi:hypothetical protein
LTFRNNRGPLWFARNRGPFGILYIYPKVEFSNPIWTTISPKVKENGEQTAGKRSQILDQKTHLLAGNVKAEHPTGQMFDMKIFAATPQAGLQ